MYGPGHRVFVSTELRGLPLDQLGDVVIVFRLVILAKIRALHVYPCEYAYEVCDPKFATLLGHEL